jgi:hypothetical protein
VWLTDKFISLPPWAPCSAVAPWRRVIVFTVAVV